MEDMMSVVVVQPGQSAQAFDIDGSLEGLQQIVGGLIEVVYPFDDNVGLVMNDEGKINGLPLNRALRGEDGEIYDVIAGPFVVVGLSADNFQSLTPEQEARYLEMYKTPERFERRNGKIIAIPMNNVMDFDQFRTEVSKALLGRLAADGIDASVEPVNVDKVQASYKGITVRKQGDPVGITIDVAPAFEYYRRSGQPDEVVSHIYEIVKSGFEERPKISVAQLGDYSWIRDRLTVEVINKERNRDLLAKIPHDNLADLAVVYRIRLFDRADGAATALVTNDMLKTWAVSEEQLKADAMVISERNHPAQIIPMQNVLTGLTGQDVPGSDMPMLVCMAEGLSSFGAGVIAYSDFGDKAAEILHGDFFILPSSRHEVIVVPAEGMNPQELEEMVRSINASEVLSAEDILSDHVYHFDVTERKLELASEYAARKMEREPLNAGTKKRGR